MSPQKAWPDLGRHVYGAAAIALGVIGLTWGEFATVWQPVPAGIPHRMLLAYVTAACLLMGGIAVQWQRTARGGLLLLAFIYLLAALLWLRRVIGYPQLVGTWSGFAEEFALVIAAASAYASLAAHGSAWAYRARHVGPVLFGLCVIAFGVAHFGALTETAQMVPKWVPPGQRFWALATGGALLLAGLSILSGIQEVLAACLLTVLLMSFGVFVWAPYVLARPHDHLPWAGSAINLAITGAAWMIADSLRSAAHGRATN